VDGDDMAAGDVFEPAPTPALERSRTLTPTRQLRVCHLIHSLRDGGAEHLLVTLSEVAAAVGLRISVVSLMPDEGLRFGQQLRRSGVEVRTVGLRSRWDPRGLPRAARLIRQLHPDVVHTHMKHADLVGAYAARRLQVPMVSTLHVIEDSPTPRQRFKRRLAAQARLRRAVRTVAVSDAQRRWYLAEFGARPDQVVTIRNGVLPRPPASGRRPAAALRERYAISEETAVAAMVALLRPGKGHGDLFAAVRRLPADLDVKVIVAGDGPLRHELEAEVARDEALSERIVLAGFVDDVEGLLAGCDLVVHPSHFDALPTALIYALAAGVPVVASRVGGIPEIVGDEAGVLVPPRDPGALAIALEALVRSPGQRARLGAAAVGRFEERFDARHWAGELKALYGEVIAEHAG
jgi:glycosyltransferase involved in cell wall biosynthesis